jgi:hypothetical protein
LTKLLTVAEYSALGETAWGYTELIQGRVLMSPSPGVGHGRALLEFAVQVHGQLPTAWAVIHNLDINLELAAEDDPGFSRRPDLIILEERAASDSTTRAGWSGRRRWPSWWNSSRRTPADRSRRQAPRLRGCRDPELLDRRHR